MSSGSAVAIDTTAPDGEVHRLFDSPSRRKAARTLITAGKRVVIGPLGVEVELPLRPFSEPHTPSEVIELLEALLELTKAGAPGGGPERTRGEGLVLKLALLGGVLSTLAMDLVLRLSASFAAIGLGLLVGPVVLLATNRRLTEATSGASNSRKMATAARLLVCIDGALLGVSMASLLGWSFGTR